ncbi:MAG: IPExxxVDY family protein [Chitinophagales bacterium]|nr:IPExxxVDY family protein [Chitinophagales bacterium]
MSSKSIIKEKQLEDNEVKILGLVSKSPIHKLAWLINNQFDWNIERVGDIIIVDDRYKKILFNTSDKVVENTGIHFPLCSYVNQGDWYEVDLIKNKVDSIVFNQELKNFDYLILIHGIFKYLPSGFLKEIKSFPQIQMAAEISIKKIKDQSLLLSYK